MLPTRAIFDEIEPTKPRERLKEIAPAQAMEVTT